MADVYTDISPLPSDFWAGPVLQGGDGKPFVPGIVGNTFMSDVQSVVIFGDVLRTPGLATVDVDRANKADLKKVAGKDGARVTTLGLDPAEIIIQIEIWTPDQYDELKGLWKQIMPRAGKTDPNVYPISHPTTKFYDVKSALVMRGTGPKPGRVPRSRIFTIHCMEWIKNQTKNAVKTQTGAPPSLADANADINDIVQAQQFATPGSDPAHTGP